ncbi:DUF1450 domain-containing protein [Brevibacillus daliensis]|uniref:DUF1450 domain-containing protein n=1 Tax=Brevibacillus daliensis TaxID=2892995 RepID=UPI001E3BA82E|nr:DUF1450 domain-containing protein [Brevibacillus daliensis]
MKALVEFCASNTVSYTQSLMIELENHSNLDVDVVEYGCLGHCGECYMQPFALVNGDFVTAETNEQLMQKIMESVRQFEAEWE